mgnify:CR=1 FL=1
MQNSLPLIIIIRNLLFLSRFTVVIIFLPTIYFFTIHILEMMWHFDIIVTKVGLEGDIKLNFNDINEMWLYWDPVG